MMSTCLLETCRGLKETCYIKELCVKLVTCQKLYGDARSAKYIFKKKQVQLRKALFLNYISDFLYYQYIPLGSLKWINCKC